MTRVLQLALAVGVASLAGGARVAAQGVQFGLGGGLIAPVSDYATVDKVGWHGTVMLNFSIPLSPVSVRVDGLYGQTTHKDIGTTPVPGKSKLIGGLANAVWHVPVSAPMVKPYLLGGVGVYHLQVTLPSAVPPVDTSETKFAWDFGAGLSLGAGPAHFFVEGRYITIQESGGSTKFIPVTVGVMFGSK
jgi:opacity protein-like surface antigen